MTGTSHLNVEVWRRQLSSTMQDRTDPSLAGDLLIATRSVPIAETDLIVGVAATVWVPIPVLVADAKFTHLITVDARTSADTPIALGMGYFNAVGMSQRRMGYYRSSPSYGFWRKLGAGSAMAMSIGAATLVLSSDLAAPASALESFEEAINLVISRAPVSVAGVPGELEFAIANGHCTWATGVIGGEDIPTGKAVDGVTIPLIDDVGTVQVTAWFYARHLGATWEAQAPGFTGDVLIASAMLAVDDASIVPGSSSMTPTNVPLTRSVVADSTMYYVVIEAQDATGTRLLSAITYQSTTGLSADQYRKF